ncbi:MAG: DUF5666 domain-containing protein [Albidovulum sp.]|uniref:DUF5666 domain-containing protein n=1 Tax=Albidovulum sp. TaxID=1872424 RepID=UPI003CC2837A
MWFRFLSVSIALLLGSVAGQAQDDDREGGIIGTGISGTITALGSIYVNGQHILYDDGLAVTGGLGVARAPDLVPGHTVAVVAVPDGEAWRARNIRQVLPLVGPVMLEGGEVLIMGTKVVMPADAVPPAPGEWLAVSGLWRGDEVVATRVDALPDGERIAMVSGTYLGAVNGRTMVGGTRIGGIEPRHLEPGDTVRVYGSPAGDGLSAVRLEKGLFDGEVGLVQVEGYYSPPQPDGLYSVLGSGLVAYTDQPGMIDPGERVLRCGAEGQLDYYTDGSPLTGVTTPELARRLMCVPPG